MSPFELVPVPLGQNVSSQARRHRAPAPATRPLPGAVPHPDRASLASDDAASRCGGDCRSLDAGIDKAFMTTATIGGVMVDGETGGITGTKDKDYNIIWFTEACLSNVLRLETYIGDAEREGDSELADFFRRAQSESRKGAEQGKQLLKSRLSS
jgi:hypothetical protein